MYVEPNFLEYEDYGLDSDYYGNDMNFTGLVELVHGLHGPHTNRPPVGISATTATVSPTKKVARTESTTPFVWMTIDANRYSNRPLATKPDTLRLSDLPSTSTEKAEDHKVEKALPSSYHYLDRRREVMNYLSTKHDAKHSISGSSLFAAAGYFWLVAIFCYLYNVLNM